MPDEQAMDIEIGDGIYTRNTGPEEDGTIAAPTSRNRKWITKDGSQDAGGQFKDGKKVEPVLDVDIK